MDKRAVYKDCPTIKEADIKTLIWGLDNYFKTDAERCNFLLAIVGFSPVLRSILNNNDDCLIILREWVKRADSKVAMSYNLGGVK